MNIPKDCPYAANPPLGLRDADRRVECCRPPRWGSRIVWEEQAVSLTRKILKTIEPDNERIEATPREDLIASAADIWAEEPLCRTMRTETEVYRFTWRSSFDGDAVVRIGRQGDEITLRWFRWFVDEAPPEPLTYADWARLKDTLIAANLWVLDPHGIDCRATATKSERLPPSSGLVASTARIGSLKDAAKISITPRGRWSPRGALYDLGRMFFELAGPPLAKVRIY